MIWERNIKGLCAAVPERAALSGHTGCRARPPSRSSQRRSRPSPLADSLTATERRRLEALATGEAIADLAVPAAFSKCEMHRRLDGLYAP